jgi:hypothetical protein
VGCAHEIERTQAEKRYKHEATGRRCKAQQSKKALTIKIMMRNARAAII